MDLLVMCHMPIQSSFSSDITAVHINEDVVMERHSPIYTRNLSMDHKDSASHSNPAHQDDVMLELKRRA